MAIEAELPDGRILEFPDGTDPAVIQSAARRIMGVGKQAAPAPAPVSEPQPTPGVADPMGTGAAEIMAQPTSDKERRSGESVAEWASRTGVADQVPFNPAEAERLSRRGYAEATKAQAERKVAVGKQIEQIAATQRNRLRQAAEAEDYGFTDFAKDSGIDLSKGVVGLGQAYVGLLNLTTGGAASRVLGRMGYDPEQTNKFLNGFQSITRQNARANVEEAKGFLDTLQTLAVNPTELIGSVVESLPGTVAAGAQGGALTRFLMEKAAAEATARGLAGSAASQFIRDRVIAQTGKIALAASAGEGVQTTGSIAEQAARKGRDWSDYVAPALAAGLGTAAVGALSGKAGRAMGIGDVETDIAARSAGLTGVSATKGSAARAILGEMGKEGLLEEMPQSAQEQIFTNIATGRPWDEGVSEAAARGAVTGAGMGGGHAAFSKVKERMGEVVQANLDKLEAPAEPTMTAEQLARSKGFLTPEAKPQTPAEAAPTTETKAALPDIESVTREIMDTTGMDEADARVRAQRRLELESELLGQVMPTTPAPTNRVEELTQEFIDAGVPPQEAQQRAVAQAQEEQDADNLAARTASGEQLVTGTDRAGVSVAGQPAAEPTAAGAGVTEPTGVVPAEQTAGSVGAGEGQQPAALTKEQVDEHPAVVLARQKAAEAEAIRAGATDTTAERAKKKAFEQTLASDFETLKELAGQGRVSLEEVQAITALIQGGTPLAQVAKRVGLLAQQAAERQAGDIQNAEIAQQEIGVAANEAIAQTEAPKRGRGRPALSPEQKEAADAARKQQRLAANQAKRNVDKAEALLTKSQEPIDESAYDNDEAVAAAQDEQLTNQRAAIRTLYQISRENKGKPGQRAAEVLKGVQNQRLVQDAKAAYEYQKTGKISRSDQGAAAVEPADAGFSKATNGAQALSQVIKTGNAFQKFLARRLRGFVNNVKFVVIEQGDPLPEQLKSEKNAKHWERARGLYIENPQTRERTVYVRGSSFGEDQGVNNVTVLHELLHAATNTKLGQALQAIQRGYSTDSKLVGVYKDLIRTMNSAGRRFNEMAKAGTLPPHISALARYGNLFEDPKEFVAYGMSDPVFQEFLMGAKGFEEDTSFFTRFVDAVRRFFNMGDDTVNALSDLMVVTDKLLSTRMTPTMRLAEYGLPEQVSPAIKLADEEKKAARSAQEIDNDVKEALKKVEASRSAEELGKAIGILHAAKDPSKILPLVKLGYDSATYKGRQVMAAVPSFDFLARWTKDTIPELSNTNVLLEKMSGMSHQLLAKVGEISEDVVRAYRKDPSLRKKLEDVVYTSTLAQVDPADTTATTRNPTLDAMYTALGAEGQRVYKRLRDYYKNMTEYYSDLLDQQLQQLDVDPDTKTNLLRVVRTIYEGKEKISPYFPLVREGDYWLRIGSGANKQFFLYGTKAARDNAARELAAQRKGDLKDLLDRGKFAIGDDVGTLREASRDSSAMLTQIFDAIDAANMADPDVVSSLKDAIYQVYLTTMPEQTFRNSFIHRKGVTGFRTDLLQNINTTGARMSVQLSRIKYAPLLRNSISQAESSIVGRNELEPFIASARNRVRAALTAGRKGDSVDQVMEAVAGTANKLSFLWYLSGASSALIQPFSVYVTGLPILTAQHGVGAAKELAKMVAYMNQYGIVRQNADGTRSYVAPSLANNRELSDDERRAVREMLTRGVTQSSYASEVFGYKSMPSETLYFDPTRGVVDNIPVALGKGRRFAHVLVGGLMHNTERLSREAIYLASYRLSRNAGKSHEQAVDQAVIDTNEALGNYDVTNRPVAMQKGLGKILLQFKMFPLHTASLLLTNFKRMLPLLNKEGKKEAAIKFFGIYGTAASVAGLVGVPGFSAVMGLLGWAWKEFGKDDDWPEDLKSLDFETWFRTVFLPKELGDWAKLVETGPLNQLTGMDLASRLSLNNLWGRDMKETKTTREGVIAAAMSNAGPTASMILSLADAYDAWKLGDTRKAVEKAAPAVLRNGAVFDRLREEGAKDYRGAELVSKDAFTTGELAGQLIGFRPALLADVQDKNFKLMGIENRINNKRNEILTRLDVAYRNKDMGKYRDAFAAMNDFNKAFPSYEIDADTLAKSLEGKQEQRGRAYVGVVPTEKNVPIIGEALVQSRKAVREREAEARKK